MLNIRVVIVAILSLATGSARALTFEQQLLQINQNASVIAQPARQAFLAPGAQALAAQGPTEWQTVTGPDGAFTAEMPGVPYHSTETLSSSGITYAWHEYSLQTNGAEYYLQTAIYPPSAKVDFSNPRQILEAGANSTAVNLDGGKWTSLTWTTRQGHTAFDGVGVSKGREIRIFALLRGKQLINVIYIGSGNTGTVRSETVNRFFASLNIR